MDSVPEKLRRYVKFIAFIMKYRNSYVVEYAAGSLNQQDSLQTLETPDGESENPEELVEDLKKMGPAWVKLGQLLSTRPDMIPPEYMKALATLQEDVSEVPVREIRIVIEEELGVRMSKAFLEFDDKPLASASIGQVHRAVLHSGRVVAVKVQRPGIRSRLADDLSTLREVVDLAVKYSETARMYALDRVLEEAEHMLLEELDYRKEAENLVVLGTNLKNFPSIVVPEPVPQYCSSKVLTMDFVRGQKVTTISPVYKTEFDFTPLVDDLVRCYLEQVVVHGFAHADPHPGNVYLTPENRIALIDLGMVARLSRTAQDQLLKILAGFGNADGDGVVDALLDYSDHEKVDNPWQFRQHVNRLVLTSQGHTASDLNTGRALIQLNRLAAESGIKMGPEINVIGKILINLDQIVACLAPQFDVQACVRRNVERLFRNRMLRELQPQELLGSLVDLKALSMNLPRRINIITEKLSNNELEIKIKAFDEQLFTDGFQKVANRITLGLVIAAMIIGATMLMRIPSTFSIWGYPGLAMLFFIVAAIAGFGLMYTIMFKDEVYRRDKSR